MAEPSQSIAVGTVLGFLEVCIHSILHSRHVYPPELFELRRKYNVPVYFSKAPSLTSYIAGVLGGGSSGAELVGNAGQGSLAKWLEKGLVDRLVLAIVDPDQQPLERFVFELGATLSLSSYSGEEIVAEAEEGLRDCLLRLGNCDRGLHPLPPGCTFQLLLYTKGVSAEERSSDWVEAVGSELCEHQTSSGCGDKCERHSCLIPIKEVQLGSGSWCLRIFATEDIERKPAV